MAPLSVHSPTVKGPGLGEGLLYEHRKEGSGSCLVACPAEGALGAAQPATRFLTRHLPVFQADFLKGLPVYNKSNFSRFHADSVCKASVST